MVMRASPADYPVKPPTPPKRLTASRLTSVRALATPFGMSVGASMVSCLAAAATWLAAELVAAPFCGLVASSSTFSEAMACSWVAFSSTLPEN